MMNLLCLKTFEDYISIDLRSVSWFNHHPTSSVPALDPLAECVKTARARRNCDLPPPPLEKNKVLNHAEPLNNGWWFGTFIFPYIGKNNPN